MFTTDNCQCLRREIALILNPPLLGQSTGIDNLLECEFLAEA